MSSSAPQASLSRDDRLTAQKNTLKASSKVASKRICIVDDISTTGSTLIEAQRALSDVGVADCYAISLFRG